MHEISGLVPVAREKDCSRIRGIEIYGADIRRIQKHDGAIRRHHAHNTATLGDFGWRVLPLHEFDISRIAELAR